MTDPRAALAGALRSAWPTTPDYVERYLAERGVLLVTLPMLATAMDKHWATREFERGFPSDAAEVAAIFAALSGEVTEPGGVEQMLRDTRTEGAP